MNQKQIKENSLAGLIKLYYTEEIHRLVHLFPRDNQIFSILIIIKYLGLQFLGISSQFQKIIDTDFNFNFLKQNGIVGYLQDSQFINTIVYILIVLNGMILTYIIFTLFRFITQKQRFISLSQTTYNPDICYEFEENISEKRSFADKYFSLLITIYQNMIYFPSLFLSLNNLGSNTASYFLLSTTMILNLIISDVDYNYEIKVKDYLSKPFSKIYFAFNTVIEICIIAAIVFAPRESGYLDKKISQNEQLLDDLSEQNLKKFQTDSQPIRLFEDASQLKLILKRVKYFLRDKLIKVSDDKLAYQKNGIQNILNLFVYLIEISESHRKYFLKFLQFTKNNKLSLKQLQIFNSIHQIFLKKRAVLRKTMGRANPFDCSYLQTCVVFTSYKDSKNLMINHVSSNFSNLFGFNSKSNVLGKNIESMIPLAFQSVHKFYLKRYLEEEITNDNQSNDNEIRQQQSIKNNLNNFKDQAPKEYNQNYSELSENISKKEAKQQMLMQLSRGSKMSQQIIFASLNKMFIQPVRIDIRTNEFKENKSFGLVAKIKQINQQYQYILFNEINLNVIGLSEQLHDTFFPDCDNLLKINLKLLFPFLVGTQDLIRLKGKDKQNIDYEKAIKNPSHKNLIEEMKEILREQQEDRQQTKNRLSFIVIKQQTMQKNTQFSSSNNSKKTQNINQISKSVNEIKNYNFTYVEMNIQELDYKGIENISYIEITKIKELNPHSQATTILQELKIKIKQNIYQLLFKYPNELQNLISLLEQQSLFLNQVQSNQESSFNTCQINPTSNFQQLSKDKDCIQMQNKRNNLQTIEDEDTDLEQVKNKIKNDDSLYKQDQIGVLKNNLLREKQIQQQAHTSNLQVNINQLFQDQSQQDQKFLQSLQEIQQNDYEEKNNQDLESEANLNLEVNQKQQSWQSSKEKLNSDAEEIKNRANLTCKDASMQQLGNQQNQINNNYSLLSPCLTDKTSNFELMISPNSTSYVNILHNQQTLSSLSNKDINLLQKKQFQLSTQNLIDPNSEKMHQQQQKQIFDKSFKTVKKQITASKQNEKYNSQKNHNSCNIFTQLSNSDGRQIKNQSSFRLTNALQQQNQKQFNNNFDKIQKGNINLQNKNHFKKHVQEIQQDIASISSKDSSSASTKRQLFQIMQDRSILQVIKAINIIGIICFTVMICITWVEYYQTYKNLSNANEDYQVFDWPTTYSSYLSNILKYQNTVYLLKNFKQLQFENDQQKLLFNNQIQSNMNLTLANLFKLLSQMERANIDREVFSLLRQQNMTYYIGQQYNTSILSSTPSIATQLVAVDYKTNIQYSAILGGQHIYRYVNNLGNGRPEYYLIKNQLAAISELQNVQIQILTNQENRQNLIQDQLAILMIILITINAACVGLIIPLYFYIQKERDSIIYLFSTFPVHKLDFLIKKIQNCYFNQNVPTLYQSKCAQLLRETMVSIQALNNEKDTRKQSISTITPLPRFNKKLIFVTFCIFFTIICYPVTVKILTQDYLNKATLDLQTMMKVYSLRSYLLQNIAMNFNILVMKVNPQLKPMTPDIYYNYLNSLNQQQQNITDDIQWIINSQYKNMRYNQELYDSFFFPIFQSNMCDTFRDYPEYNTNSTKIDVNLCASSDQEFLQQGLQIAII
ncbi:hypothetical protein ABPG74_000531 [Tetrahymena malaccensis]